MDQELRAKMLLSFRQRPAAAHAYFFEHRHPFRSAPFHGEIVADWWSAEPRALHKAFRGAAKSTKAEEAISLMGCMSDFNNCVILKSSETRAKEALTAIKAIYSTNDKIVEFFGDMLGPVVSETKLVLANGIAIHAAGKRQSLRGMKHNQYRPDLLFCDDMEDEEDVRTREAHDKFMKWFYAEVLPSLQQPYHRIRIVGTPLADREQCIIEKLTHEPSWRARSIPIRYYNEQGEQVSAWPELYPLDKIGSIEKDYRRAGRYEAFSREYLVQGTPTEGQTFEASMFRVMPTIRSWQQVYAAFDPARTTSAQAAFTGWAVWSMFGSRIHIWEAAGEHLAPDAIRDKIFEMHDKYSPTFIGVEKDGLDLFLMQPLRAEMLRRGVLLPIKELRAPRDRSKSTFIEGLQPFARAGEITLNEPMEELIGQFVSYPKGRNDIVNALAYFGDMRGGAPVYDFTEASLDEDLKANLQNPLYVLFNSDGAYVSAVIAQYVNGHLNILSDYLVEGAPSESFSDLYARVNLDARALSNSRVQIRFIAPTHHFAPRDTIGLRAAASKARLALGSGGQEIKGRSKLQDMLRTMVRQRMAARVNPIAATYTARGLAGGFYKVISHGSMVNAIPERNIYAIVIESIESYAAAMVGYQDSQEENIRYAVSADGRTYITSKP